MNRLPTPVDLQAEEQRIRQATDKWYEAENRKDIDTVMQFMNDDCVLQVPGVAMLEGHEAIRAFMSEFLKSLVSIEGGPMTIVPSSGGDLAYHYGTSTAVLEGPDGQVDDPEKYLMVWKKVDGDWKVVAGSSSSDRPM